MRTPFRNSLAAIAALALIGSAALPGRAADEEIVDVRPAMAAAEAWLAIVDAGRYGEGWEKAAPIVRDTITKVAWETKIDEVRNPLGVVNARKLRSANFTRALPNAKPGEYVVIQYDTYFANRPLSTEIVTPMKDSDGAWRVAGYVIR